jgi:Branched-chain amino acid ATP-binding cassette transporter
LRSRGASPWRLPQKTSFVPSRENIGNEAKDSPQVTRSSPEPSTFASQSANSRPAGSWWFDAKTIYREFGCMKGAVGLIRRVTAGKTLVMVEHDMSVVFDLADVVTVLVYGQVIASGPPAEIRASPAVQEAYLGAPAGGTGVEIA